MKGVIHKYQSPSGKVYIGQTVEEKKRRKVFLNLNNDYAGEKINNARKKYGPDNFKYVVLEEIENENIDELARELDKKECYYIGLYDSFKRGYNHDSRRKCETAIITVSEAMICKPAQTAP